MGMESTLVKGLSMGVGSAMGMESTKGVGSTNGYGVHHGCGVHLGNFSNSVMKYTLPESSLIDRCLRRRSKSVFTKLIISVSDTKDSSPKSPSSQMSWYKVPWYMFAKGNRMVAESVK